MLVEVSVARGQDLAFGIKTSNLKRDGTRATNNNTGWFKVDFFRIHLIAEAEDPDGMESPSVPAPQRATLYDLQGRQMESDGKARRGIYVKEGKKICVL